MASAHQGRGVPCAHLPRPLASGVRVRARLCTNNATAGPLLCAPALVCFWSDPEEGYLLSNLFVEVLSCQRPGTFGPERGRGCVWTPGPDPTCVCRKMDLYILIYIHIMYVYYREHLNIHT